MFEIAVLEPDGGPDRDVAQNGFILIAHPGAGAEPVRHDRDQSSACLQPSNGCLEMADGSIVVCAAAERARERRVHQDERRAVACRKHGVDGRAVVAGHRSAGEDVWQPNTTRAVEFVEVERPVGRDLCHQKPVAGAGLQDHIVGLTVGEQHGNGGNVDGGRELLPFDLLFAAHGLGRQPRGKVDQRRDVSE